MQIINKEYSFYSQTINLFIEIIIKVIQFITIVMKNSGHFTFKKS